MQIGKKTAGWLARAGRGFSRSKGSPYREQGKAAASQRKWAEAETAFRRHLKIKPHDGQTWLRLANVLKDSGQLEDAEKVYARACEKLPDSPDAWLNRGHLAKMDGRSEDALRHYLQSFKLNGAAAAGREIHALGGRVVIQGRDSSVIGSIDGMVGRTLWGWAVDPDAPEAPAKLELLQNEVRVGETVARIKRSDVQAAGFGTAIAGFRTSLNGSYRPDAGPITVRLAGSQKPLANSPYQPSEMDSVSQWLERWENVAPGLLEQTRALHDGETDGLKLSIIMPVYNPPEDWLDQAIGSVLAQTCSRWELLCVDDASTLPHVQTALQRHAAGDARIKVVRMEENGGISRATNAGLALATGDYVGLMDHDDALEPEAVYRMLDAAKSGADLIYSDEVIVGEELEELVEIVARPAYSYDYYLSHPYFVHFVCVKRELAQDVGGLDPELSISMDVDFMLRVQERAEAVAHVPVPLYRWRTHGTSAGHARKDAVMAATRGALERHHARLGRPATVSNGKTFNTYRTDYADQGGRVLAVIPTKNRLDLLKPCVESVLETTGDEVDLVVIDHQSDDADVAAYLSDLPERVRVLPYEGAFNFSRMNNLAVGTHGRGYEFFLFLNNDIETIRPGWLEHMRGLCQREDVGVVGGLLLYGDERIQHGGVVLGVGGPAEHVHKAEPYDMGEHLNPGYISDLVSVRDYMAVTGACMMVRSDLFRAIHGFDELLAVGFNDIDLCLRARRQGYKVLFDGHAVLHHYESATRAQSKQIAHPGDTALMEARWADLLARPDPYFSPLFSREAPASNAVTETIDVNAPVRLWKKRRPLKKAQARPTRIRAPEPFN